MLFWDNDFKYWSIWNLSTVKLYFDNSKVLIFVCINCSKDRSLRSLIFFWLISLPVSTKLVKILFLISKLVIIWFSTFKTILFSMLLKRFVEKMGGLKNNITSQRNFLLRMGIQQRAEIISKNLDFSKKADIYFRFKRLTDENQMGNLFKVMLIKNQKNKFKLGF